MTANDITLDPSQLEAVELTCTQSIGLVTGGPGTGKSTCLGYALDRLDAAGKTYELAAPTGKAAKRVTETTGRPARTIHRLLEYNPRRGGFQRNADFPLNTSVVIVDESSMIDAELSAALLDAIDPRYTRLILIGDADQLPPVGPGRFFGEQIDSRMFPTVRLQTLHRSAQQSWIHVNAPKVLVGDALDLSPQRDFRWIKVDNASDILPAIRRIVTDKRNADLNAQVLIPQKTKVAGTMACNRMLQDAFNPRRSTSTPYIPRGESELRPGDRVIQTKNNYFLGVFNGELGDVVDIADGKVHVQLHGRELVVFTLEQAEALQHAWALTVHRSQGSEFPWAIVVCHSTHSHSLSRQLIYTAITRGKKGVILVGDKKGLDYALSEHRPPKRNTALIDLVRLERRKLTKEATCEDGGF